MHEIMKSIHRSDKTLMIYRLITTIMKPKSSGFREKKIRYAFCIHFLLQVLFITRIVCPEDSKISSRIQNDMIIECTFVSGQDLPGTRITRKFAKPESDWLAITMTSLWARCRLKSPASPLFTQSFIRAQIKENIKAPRHWPLCGKFTGDRWIPRTNGQ